MKFATVAAVLFSINTLTFAGDAASPLAGSRPNIIFILSDDQGYADLGRNGNPILKTPNLDAMFDEGRHFEDFHVSPTCSPSRASLMTGRHEFKNGVTHTILERERLSLKAVLLPQLLKSAGYTTGIFGKWHLGDEEPYQPEKRGFDEVYIHGGGGIGQSYPGSCGDVPGNTYFNPVVKHNGTFEKTTGFCTDIFFAQATKWVESVKGKQPFFLYLPTNAAHEPLSCPASYKTPYAGKVSNKVETFFGMIANIDENVGKLRSQLKQWGIENNTLVIYMNDNGGYDPATRVWNAGMRGSKNTAFNGGTRAMSLWCWPGKIMPGASTRLTAHLDILPTFTELAGAKIPADLAPNLDGFSLVPLLENPQAPWHDERMLITHAARWGELIPGADPVKFGRCSVRWKQFLQVYEKQGWNLYDLESDPGEKSNIAAKHADVVAKLSSVYDAWWAEVEPCLENEKAYLTAPKINPFKAAYWKQFKGPGPNNVPPPK